MDKIGLIILVSVFTFLIVERINKKDNTSIITNIHQLEDECIYNILYIDNKKGEHKYIDIHAPCDCWTDKDSLTLIKY